MHRSTAMKKTKKGLGGKKLQSVKALKPIVTLSKKKKR
jgi:hypothetical protein